MAKGLLTRWESLRPFLDLSPQDREDICKAYERDQAGQRRECLEMWKERKGEKATFRALITAAENARLQNLADGVTNMLEEEQTRSEGIT